MRFDQLMAKRNPKRILILYLQLHINKEDQMTEDKFVLTMEICSNCKEHQWCTRHNETTYSVLAQDISNTLKNKHSSIDVQINPVSGNRMGSFEIACNGTLLFSKLNLGYFPHVTGVVSRISEFIDDVKNGNDLTKYQDTKSNPTRNSAISFTKSGKSSLNSKPNHRNEKALEDNIIEGSNNKKNKENQFHPQQESTQKKMPLESKLQVGALEKKENEQRKQKREVEEKMMENFGKNQQNKQENTQKEQNENQSNVKNEKVSEKNMKEQKENEVIDDRKENQFEEGQKKYDDSVDAYQESGAKEEEREEEKEYEKEYEDAQKEGENEEGEKEKEENQDDHQYQNDFENNESAVKDSRALD